MFEKQLGTDQQEQDEKPTGKLTGWVRLIRQCLEGGLDFPTSNMEVYEVWEGRLPVIAILDLDDCLRSPDSGSNPNLYSRIKFLSRETARGLGIKVANLHLNYGPDYPAVGLRRTGPSDQIHLEDITAKVKDFMEEVRAFYRLPKDTLLSREQAELVSKACTSVFRE